MNADQKAPSTWWGDFDLQEGQTARWRIGPLQLWILQAGREWRLAWARESGERERQPEWELDSASAMPEQAETLERYLFRKAGSRLRLRPALADRPVVTSPRVPVFLLPGESADLYVGSPLWVRIEVGTPWNLIREIPVNRPSDTWFGVTTGEGEACYANRTRASLDPSNLPLLFRRALTRVTIQNRVEEPLRIEQLKLPVPLLALYQSDSLKLWTESVTLVREEVGEMASLEVHGGAPREAGGAKRLTEPREKREKAPLIRAFSTLFRSISEEES